MNKRTILVVGIGTTPAVLTETVWALAHQLEPVVPDQIEVITTGYYGVGLLEDELKTIIAKYERDGWIVSSVLYKGATFDCADKVGTGIGALLLTGCSHKWIITLKKE